MKTFRVVPLAALPIAVAAGLALTQAAAEVQGDAAGVRKSCEAIVTAWNRHDAKAIAAVFAEDADLVTPDGQLFSGRAAIEKAFAADHTGVLREASLQVMKEPVRFPTPDVAVTDAEVVVTGALGPDGKKAPPMSLVVTSVWRKADGKWWVFASRPHVKTPPPAAK